MGEEKKIPQKVDLDYILVNEIGQLGWYQIRNIMLIALPIIFSAAGAEYIFTLSRLTTRCRIPECDVADPELAPSWLLNAVPGNSLSDFDNCNRYINTTNIAPAPGTCPATLFNQNQLVRCEEYVYDRTDSAVYDFGLECEDWLLTLAGTLGSIGSFIVLPITGYISDRWGRRLALSLNVFNSGWTGVVRSFSVNYDMYIWNHFIAATIGSGTFSSSFLLATELVGPKYRVVVGATISSLFAVGNVLMGLVAWAIPHWRTLLLATFAPQMLIVVYFWILSESVRWLLSKKRYDEAKEVLLKAASVNNRQISEKTIEALIANSDSESKEDKSVSEPWLVSRILRSPIMLRRCCTTPIWWVTATFVYYGLNINSVSLAGNMYVNYMLVAAIEIPGYWLAILLLNRIGRKVTLCIGYMTAFVCCMSFPFVSNDLAAVSLFLYLLGKLAISMVFTSLYLYTAELYPTKHRHSLLGFSSMVGRIGSITAPLTPALMIYWPGIPSVMFGAMAFISGLLVLTTPETLGTTLPDTIEEAEQLGRKTTV